MPLPLLDYDTLSFDCYGTMIDWETGLLAALTPCLSGTAPRADALLEAFARLESDEQAASPGLPYPEILARVHRRLAAAWGVASTDADAEAFGRSVGDWPAFPDTTDALRSLRRRYRLVILSNVDRGSFEKSRVRLGVDFDFVFTAQDIGSYKPDPRNFAFMLERLAAKGIAREGILHVAQSLFHDHLPATGIGLATCWIDRRHARQGWGATPAPAREIGTDYRFDSLAALAAAVEAQAASA